MSAVEFRESIGFAAGVSFERRRVYELVQQRIATLYEWAGRGIPMNTVEKLASELQLLLNALDEAA